MTHLRGTVVEVLRAAVGVGHAVRAAGRSQQPVLDTVLAVRQLGQAVLVLRAGTPDAHTLSGVVDAAHGATMVPLALLDPRRRRFAVVQVVISAALAIAEGAAVGTGRRADGRGTGRHRFGRR